MMEDKQKLKKIVADANKLKELTRTNCVTLGNYCYYMDLKVNEEDTVLYGIGICSKPKAVISKDFKRAFRELSKLERAEFYLLTLQQIARLLREQQCNSNDSFNSYNIEDIVGAPSKEIKKMRISIKDGRLYKSWKDVDIQIFRQQKIIKITEVKEQIDLHSFLVRKSKNKQRVCLALQAATFTPTSDTIRISCPSIDYEDHFGYIMQVWQEAQQENVKQMYYEGTRGSSKKKKLVSMKSSFDIVPSDPITCILSNSFEEETNMGSRRMTLPMSEKEEVISLEAYRKIQKRLVSEEMLQSLNTYINFTEVSFGVFYEKGGNKVRKVFELDHKFVTEKFIAEIIDEVSHVRRRKHTVESLKILKEFPGERTKIFREFDHYGEEDVEYIYLRHNFYRNGITYFVEKSIDFEEFDRPKLETILRGHIEHCLWRIRKIGDQLELFAEASITYNKKLKNPLELTSKYIGDFIDYVKNRVIEEEEQFQNSSRGVSFQTHDFQMGQLSQMSDSFDQYSQEQFYTITDSLGDENALIPAEDEPPEIFVKKTQSFHEQVLSSYQNQNQEQEEQQEVQTPSSAVQPLNKVSSKNMIQKHPMMPQQKGQSILMASDKGHCLWRDEWKITENGDLVNIDQEKIKIQSSVLKLVVKRMGRNLLAGKSVLNMSLPIEIFGIDSNLEKLTRGYIYAPRFLEKASKCKNPVDKLKYAFCFGLGFSLAYIEMQKPFNPILGETYQGIIDGCPVFGEQISHHPPISSLLMVGRGYRIFGNFEAKVEMGMNSASGINEGFNNICFEDGTVIKLNGPPGEISGLIYGDRKLSLTRQSVYIDKGNRLFLEIMWGKDKSGKDQFSKFNDHFSGTIVRIKESALQNINLDTDYKKLKKDHVEEQLGVIYGRFTGKVYFNQELLFDVQNDRPFQMLDYEQCLESDCRHRVDIKYRKLNDYIKAQEGKQYLEEIQRRDRRLRKEMHP